MVASPMVGYQCQVNLASGSTSGTDLILTDKGDHATFTVPFADTHRYIDRAVAVAVQTSIDNGSTWSSTLASTLYTLRYLTAQVVLNTPLSAGTTYKVRLHTFNYYPYAPIVQAWDIVSNVQTAMLETTPFTGPGGAGNYTCTPGVTKGTYACKSWQPTPGSDIYLAHLLARDLLILSLFDPNGLNYAESYVYTDSSTLMGSITTVAEEDLSFTCDSIISLI